MERRERKSDSDDDDKKKTTTWCFAREMKWWTTLWFQFYQIFQRKIQIKSARVFFSFRSLLFSFLELDEKTWMHFGHKQILQRIAYIKAEACLPRVCSALCIGRHMKSEINISSLLFSLPMKKKQKLNHKGEWTCNCFSLSCLSLACATFSLKLIHATIS